MPSTDRRLELKAKDIDGSDRLTAGCVFIDLASAGVSQTSVYAKGLGADYAESIQVLPDTFQCIMSQGSWLSFRFLSVHLELPSLLLVAITNKMQLSNGILLLHSALIVQHVSSVMSLIIRNLNCICSFWFTYCNKVRKIVYITSPLC